MIIFYTFQYHLHLLISFILILQPRFLLIIESLFQTMYPRIAHQSWFNEHLAPCVKFVRHSLVNRFDLFHSFIVSIKELQTGFLQCLVFNFLLLRTLFLFIDIFNLILSNDCLNFLNRLVKYSLELILLVVDVILSEIFNLLN